MIINKNQRYYLHFCSANSLETNHFVTSLIKNFKYYQHDVFIDAWFTDQNNKLIEVEDNVNITLIIR